MGSKEALELIRRGTVEIIEEQELLAKLDYSADKKRPLVVKAGFDPSAPDIHLGHTVLLRKLKAFQDLGHKVVFLIGDFTAMIGDPSGRSEIRKRLTEDEVRENAKTYKKQVSKILDIERCEVAFNSKWLKSMSLADFLDLASRQTVARVLERADFYERYKQGKDISMLEFIYPLLQAYDSVILKADIEIGGTDQKFNLLMGRTIQRRYDQSQQVVITMPLLEGTDGVQKMSKSLNNYIAITDTPKEMFGKVMSISDDLMWRYFQLLTDISLNKIETMKAACRAGSMNPKDSKIMLAKEIVGFYHSNDAAEKAHEEFERFFKMGHLPEDMPEHKISEGTGPIWICRLLTETALVSSSSEARRLIQQSAVLIDDRVVSDENEQVQPANGMVIKVGKRRIVKLIF